MKPITNSRLRMLTPLLSLGLALGLALPATAASQEPVEAAATADQLPDAKALIAAFDKAVGAEVGSKKKSVQITGKMEILGMGMGGDLNVVQARPDSFLLSMEMAGFGTTKQGYHNGVGWSNNPMVGPMLAEGIELAQMRYSSVFTLGHHPLSWFDEIKTVDRVAFEGQPCYKVKLIQRHQADIEDVGTPEETLEYRTMFEYFSVETGLMVGMENTAYSMGSKIDTTTVLSDYTDFGGVKMAKTTTQKTPMANVKITLGEVVFDKVDATVFQLPAEIAALLEEPAEPEPAGKSGE